jgi:hypothetical protein
MYEQQKKKRKREGGRQNQKQVFPLHQYCSELLAKVTAKAAATRVVA